MDEITKKLGDLSSKPSSEEVSSALKKDQLNDLYQEYKDAFLKMGDPSNPEQIKYAEDLAKKRALQEMENRLSASKPKLPPRIPESLLKETGPSSSAYQVVDPADLSREIDVGTFKKLSAAEKGLKGLGLAAGLGLATKDIQEKNAGNTLVDLLEGGASLSEGAASRIAPFLELLRSTPTATEEQEMAELEKHKRFKGLQNMLIKQKEVKE